VQTNDLLKLNKFFIFKFIFPSVFMKRPKILSCENNCANCYISFYFSDTI